MKINIISFFQIENMRSMDKNSIRTRSSSTQQPDTHIFVMTTKTIMAMKKTIMVTRGSILMMEIPSAD